MGFLYNRIGIGYPIVKLFVFSLFVKQLIIGPLCIWFILDRKSNIGSKAIKKVFIICKFCQIIVPAFGNPIHEIEKTSLPILTDNIAIAIWLVCAQRLNKTCFTEITVILTQGRAMLTERSDQIYVAEAALREI